MNDDGMTAACGGHDAEAQRQTLLLYFQRLTSLGNFLAKHVTTVVKEVFETSLKFSKSKRVREVPAEEAELVPQAEARGNPASPPREQEEEAPRRSKKQYCSIKTVHRVMRYRQSYLHSK